MSFSVPYSIVILSKNDANLDACVDALRARGEKGPVVVVDDGLETERLDCEYVMGVDPFVFARNANIGIRHADRDFILLNDDALLSVDRGFQKLHEVGRQNPQYGIIGAVTNLTGQPLQRPQGIGLRPVDHFAFVCVLIPKTTYDSVGPLDERYCLDYGVEDRDYCHAVQVAGLECGVYDECYVDHSQLVSTFRGDPRTPKSFKQNLGLFAKKWGFTPR